MSVMLPRNPMIAAVGLTLCGAALAIGVSGVPARATDDADVPAGDEVPVTTLREFDLIESDEVLNVTPMVSVDPEGGFLVADVREAQVRRYGPGGELIWHTGRKGGGPGEYVAPTAAVRLDGGQVVVVDRTGRLTTYQAEDPAAAARKPAVARTDETGLNHVEELAALGDSLLLVGGVREGNHDGPRLHLWDLRTHSIRTSFFSPLPHALNRTAAYVAGWTKVSVRNDSIAAVFATSDTVYVFTPDLRLARKVPLPSRYFRRGTRAAPGAGVSTPREQTRWMSRFDFVEAVHWLADGTLLVPYQSVDPETGERRRHLLRMGRDGTRLGESRDRQRLLDVDPVSGLLYFVHRDAEVPNRWSVARLQ